MSPKQFREDVRRSKSILEDLTGEAVIGYRAPTFSIDVERLWALEILAEEGYCYDSSIFPIRHDNYGIPEAPRFPFTVLFNGNKEMEVSPIFLVPEGLRPALSAGSPAGCDSPPVPRALPMRFPSSVPGRSAGTFRRVPSGPDSGVFSSPIASPSSNSIPLSAVCKARSIVEFPLSTIRLSVRNFPISGGGYFRLLPYRIIRNALRRINREEKQPFIFYLHPWEIDVEQPRITGAGLKSRFRHYVNLDKTENRLKKLLAEFQFSSIGEMIRRYSTSQGDSRNASPLDSQPPDGGGSFC